MVRSSSLCHTCEIFIIEQAPNTHTHTGVIKNNNNNVARDTFSIFIYPWVRNNKKWFRSNCVWRALSSEVPRPSTNRLRHHFCSKLIECTEFYSNIERFSFHKRIIHFSNSLIDTRFNHYLVLTETLAIFPDKTKYGADWFFDASKIKRFRPRAATTQTSNFNSTELSKFLISTERAAVRCQQAKWNLTII